MGDGVGHRAEGAVARTDAAESYLDGESSIQTVAGFGRWFDPIVVGPTPTDRKRVAAAVVGLL